MYIKQCVALLLTKAAAYPEGSPLPLSESRNVTIFCHAPWKHTGFLPKDFSVEI